MMPLSAVAQPPSHASPSFQGFNMKIVLIIVVYLHSLLLWLGLRCHNIPTIHSLTDAFNSQSHATVTSNWMQRKKRLETKVKRPSVLTQQIYFIPNCPSRIPPTHLVAAASCLSSDLGCCYRLKHPFILALCSPEPCDIPHIHPVCLQNSCFSHPTGALLVYSSPALYSI